ncbi:hypothetical protein [Nocardia africana]
MHPFLELTEDEAKRQLLEVPTAHVRYRIDIEQRLKRLERIAGIEDT